MVIINLRYRVSTTRSLARKVLNWTVQVFFNFTACFGHECTISPSLCFMVYFIVDGGHRAIIFSRIGGIQDNIYTEGLHFRYSTAWSNLFTYSRNKNITCACMIHAFVSEMCIRLSLARENSWVVLLIGCAAWEIWFNQSEKSKLKHRKNHKSLLSGRFGDPYRRLGDLCQT